MNAARRKEIAKAQELIAEAIEILTGARDDEQDYFDAMPESLQGAEKGEAAEAAVSALEEAIDALEGVTLEGAVA
jgi:hypothetical protein